jgi:hypothetical protein
MGRVIVEISKFRKNPYSHIDRSFLRGKSEFEEVFDEVATFGMCLVKQLRMELDAVNPPALLLHRLYLARLVRCSLAETIRQLFHFVTVVVPDSYL